MGKKGIYGEEKEPIVSPDDFEPGIEEPTDGEIKDFIRKKRESMKKTEEDDKLEESVVPKKGFSKEPERVEEPDVDLEEEEESPVKAPDGAKATHTLTASFPIVAENLVDMKALLPELVEKYSKSGFELYFSAQMPLNSSNGVSGVQKALKYLVENGYVVHVVGQKVEVLDE